jgi:hypothetical protein
MNATVDRRKGTDRRTQNLKLSYDRRVKPDRRLNNISAEWIPIDEVALQPTLREAFSSQRSKK